ncbi:MAG: hypothetical protein M3Q39_15550, partial [Actinomycetota bacterium]|nr:hypothetical protein [Actinomycetota bacterium]
MKVLDVAGLERFECGGCPSPDVGPESLLCLFFGAELERGQLTVDECEAGNLRVVQLPTVEDEREQIIPRPVRRHPVDAEQAADAKFEAKLLGEFTLC